MIRTFVITLLAGAALSAPALAQEFEPPRFEGLEQQLRNLDQSQYDRLETERQRNRDSAIAGRPDSPASRALRDLEIQQRQQDFVRRYEEDRAREAREREIAAANLSMRRIAPSSTLAIREPEQQGLPAPPAGKYYARVNGRLVLVDATSELVTEIVTPRPAARHEDPFRSRLPLTGANDTLAPQSPIVSVPTASGGARDPHNADLQSHGYQLACLPGGGPNPNATNPVAASACPGARRGGG